MDIGTKELRRRLSEILDRVARGERVIVHRRGRLTVTLAPLVPRAFRPPSLAAFRAGLRVRGRSLSAEVVAACPKPRRWRAGCADGAAPRGSRNDTTPSFR